MKSFFIGIWIEKRRDGAIKTHRGHFYFVSGKRHKIGMPSSLPFAVRESESGEKNRISLLCKAALG